MTLERTKEIDSIVKGISIKELKHYIEQKEKELTVEQWLKEYLTEEQFENAKKCKLDKFPWERYVKSFNTAIYIGFDWNKMPEGFPYWQEVYDKGLLKEL